MVVWVCASSSSSSHAQVALVLLLLISARQQCQPKASSMNRPSTATGRLVAVRSHQPLEHNAHFALVRAPTSPARPLSSSHAQLQLQLHHYSSGASMHAHANSSERREFDKQLTRSSWPRKRTHTHALDSVIAWRRRRPAKPITRTLDQSARKRTRHTIRFACASAGAL